jgi:hypothetical protein
MPMMQISGQVIHSNEGKKEGVVANAAVRLCHRDGTDRGGARTNESGQFDFTADCEEGLYVLRCRAFEKSSEHEITIDRGDSHKQAVLDLELGFRLSIHNPSYEEERLLPATHAVVGRNVIARVETAVDSEIESYQWKAHRDAQIVELGREARVLFGRSGRPVIEATIVERRHDPRERARAKGFTQVPVSEPDVQTIGGDITVRLDRTPSPPTRDAALWEAILDRTDAIHFNRYHAFINRVLELEGEGGEIGEAVARRVKNQRFDYRGLGAYEVLRLITEAFLLLECGVYIDPREARRLDHSYSREEIEQRLRAYLEPNHRLPYIQRVIDAAFPEVDREVPGARRVITDGINDPLLIELWYVMCLEQSMLMQSIEAVTQRFQNIRGIGNGDPLANMEIDPLRRLNNFLHGWIRAEPDRLTATQRFHEYAHVYGLTPTGPAAAGIRPAETRSDFLEAFHNFLYHCAVFYKEDANTTIIADAYLILRDLQRLHLILAQGAGNECWGITWEARVETLMMQFMMARREMHDFLQSRAMVLYKAPWEAQVDAMKTLQGWNNGSIAYWVDLAEYGEKLLLLARYHYWPGVGDDISVKDIIRQAKPQVLGFISAYRAVAGLDLTNPDAIGATIPAVDLQGRLAVQGAQPHAPSMLSFNPALRQVTPRLTNRARRSER